MPFAQIDPLVLARAQKILPVLEMTEFRWTIRDVLEQPEAELEAVFAMKAIGERIKLQSRRAQSKDVEKI
jgi:hypothetical protein